MPKSTSKQVRHITREVEKLTTAPEIKEQLMEAIEKVSPVQQVSQGPLKPGSHSPNRMGKVPWTLRQCEEVFGVEEGVPEHTIKITWNGIMRQFLADELNCHPRCHWDIYRQWRIKIRGRDLQRNLRRLGIEHGEYPGSLV